MADKISVVLMIENLEDGGAEGVVLNIAGELDPTRFAVWVVLAENVITRSVPDDLEVVILDGVTEPDKAEQLGRLLKQRRPDLAFAHLSESNIRVLRAREQLDYRLPVIAVEHTMPSRLMADFWPHSEAARQELIAAMCEYYPRAEAVVAMCATAADDVAQLTRLDRERVLVLPNPVLAANVTALAKEPVSHPWLQNPDVDVVLCMGRLTAVKNYDFMLRAVPEMQRIRPSIRLMLVGRGELEEDLRASAEALGVSDDVDFVGQVENPFPYLAGARVLAIPSIVEGLPNVLIEALACGTPAVSTRLAGGSWEVLEQTGLGRIVPRLDLADFAAAVVELIENPPAEDGYAAITEPFTIANSVARYERLLLDIIEQPETVGRRQAG